MVSLFSQPVQEKLASIDPVSFLQRMANRAPKEQLNACSLSTKTTRKTCIHPNCPFFALQKNEVAPPQHYLSPNQIKPNYCSLYFRPAFYATKVKGFV